MLNHSNLVQQSERSTVPSTARSRSFIATGIASDASNRAHGVLSSLALLTTMMSTLTSFCPPQLLRGRAISSVRSARGSFLVEGGNYYRELHTDSGLFTCQLSPAEHYVMVLIPADRNPHVTPFSTCDARLVLPIPES